MEKNISKKFNKHLVEFLKGKTNLDEEFRFDTTYNVLYSILPVFTILVAATIISLNFADVFGNSVYLLYLLIFAAWPIVKYLQKINIKKMDELIKSYLYGEKTDRIKEVFNYYYYIDYGCADYFRFRNFTHLKLREYMMEEKELQFFKSEIINQIGENAFLDVLKYKEIKTLINEQNGISWYCMSIIISYVNSFIANKKTEDFINELVKS